MRQSPKVIFIGYAKQHSLPLLIAVAQRQVRNMHSQT